MSGAWSSSGEGSAHGIVAVKCRTCGGHVAMAPGQQRPACLFCGSPALVQEPVPEGIEAPRVRLPFTMDEAGADAAFRSFARSSIWYPGDLRGARLELSRLMLPAWLWSGQVESHWAGLVRAGTRSGKRPTSGAETAHLDGELVPSSPSLSRAELAALAPFDAAAAVPVELDMLAEPYELGTLTRSAATQAAMEALRLRHASRISAAHSLLAVRVSSLFQQLSGEPLLLPIYICAYRYGDRSYRVVINGQTGKLTGKAPISWWRVGLAVALAMGLLGMILSCIGILGAITAHR